MEVIIDDLGIHMTENQIKLFTQILTLFPDIKNLSFQSSSGSSVVISDNSDKNRIYQFYLFEKTFEQVKLTCNILKELNLDGFVKSIDYLDQYQTIIFERVEPIVKWEDKNVSYNISLLINNMLRTCYDMKKFGITHNDLRLDNIGYSPIKNKYLVYDFETVNFNHKHNTDLYTLFNSINFHKSSI